MGSGMTDKTKMKCDKCGEFKGLGRMYLIREKNWGLVLPDVVWCTACLISTGTKTTLFRLEPSHDWNIFIPDGERS